MFGSRCAAMKGCSGTPFGETFGNGVAVGTVAGIGVTDGRGTGVVSIVTESGGVDAGVVLAIGFPMGLPPTGTGVATAIVGIAPVSGTGWPGATVSKRTSSGVAGAGGAFGLASGVVIGRSRR